MVRARKKYVTLKVFFMNQRSRYKDSDPEFGDDEVRESLQLRAGHFQKAVNASTRSAATNLGNATFR